MQLIYVASDQEEEPMDVPLAVLADAANLAADGRLNILGIFGEIRSSQFPAIHPAAVLVFQLRAHRSETRVIPIYGR